MLATCFTQLTDNECGENQNNDIPHIDSQFGSLNMSSTPVKPTVNDVVRDKIVEGVKTIKISEPVASQYLS